MEPNEIVVGCMLDALVCNERVEEAVTLCHQWKRTVKPNAVIFSTLVKGFSNARQADRAMDIYHDFLSEGVQMNSVCYNALIDSQARVGDMDQVTLLFEAMRRDGIAPDVVTYSTIVKGYCVQGDLDHAFDVFRGMQRDSMAREAIVYNTVLDGCANKGRIDLAEALLEDMEKYNVIPTNFTLGILVKMYGRARQVDKAFHVVDSLTKRHDFAANKEVLTCLIRTCLSNRAFDRALKVFDRLRRSANGADAKAYQTIILGLRARGGSGMRSPSR